MSVINKRNAVFGWVAWNVVKQAAKQKARREDGNGRGKLVAPAAIAAAVGGAILFWRRRQNDEG